MSTANKDQRYKSAKWRTFRLQILWRDNWTCSECGNELLRHAGRAPGAACVDHIFPTQDGGAFYDPANTRAMCFSCNSKRASRGSKRSGPRYGPRRKWVS